MAVHPVKTDQPGIRPVWSESSLSTWRNPWSLATHSVHIEDSDQTGRMPRLIWVFAGRTFILLVLPCRGSNNLSNPSVEASGYRPLIQQLAASQSKVQTICSQKKAGLHQSQNKTIKYLKMFLKNTFVILYFKHTHGFPVGLTIIYTVCVWSGRVPNTPLLYKSFPNYAVFH